MFCVVLLTIGVLVILYKIRWYRAVKYIEKIPGPSLFFLPIFGNIPEFYCPLDELWLKVRKTLNIYYPIIRVWSFEEPLIAIWHPDDVEVILSSTKHITKSPMYDFLHPWLKTGLLTSTGPKWKNRRRILTPSFHFNVLNQFVNVFEMQAEQLVNAVKSSGKEIHDVIPLFTKFTLDTICETAMGTDLEDDYESQEFRGAVHTMGQIIFYQIISPWTRITWLFKLLRSGRIHTRTLRVLHDFSRKIIKRRKKYHEENEVINFDRLIEESNAGIDCFDDGKKSRKRVALLDLLINSWKRGEIDNSGIQEEVDTFIFEGHDTTAAGLIFTVLLLAEHTEIQEEARKEVNEVFEQCPGKLGISELQKLNYLERCIKEALRLFPSVPLIARAAAEDVTIRGYLIPKGTTIGLFIYDLHRDENFWPNPNQFDPDRFLPEKIRNRHPYSYIPFSAGPRNCIGQKFAMLELKSAVAHLLHNFKIELVDRAADARLLQDIVMRCKHPLRAKFVPINN